MASHTVFLCHDYMLVEIIDEIARRLGALDVEVIRGPETTPGRKLVYPPERYAELFGRAEVMMFS